MSCLAPAPLSDLVTKDFLTAELSRYATKEDFAHLDTKVSQLDTKVDILTTRHDDDRKANRFRHYWLAGIGLSAAVPIWLGAVGLIG